jgi:hypothetical protein
MFGVSRMLLAEFLGEGRKAEFGMGSEVGQCGECEGCGSLGVRFGVRNQRWTWEGNGDEMGGDDWVLSTEYEVPSTKW